MSPQLPGITLSIVRSATSTQSGTPILVTGALTVFGIGLPAAIRVHLSGPDYQPEDKTFDAFAEPISGSYSVQVTPSKDGNYTVFAEAFPVPQIPSGPLLAGGLNLLPSIATSLKPPLVVGAPTAGGVLANTPAGSQLLSTPTQSPIEVSVGAPSTNISLPSGGGGGIVSAPPITLAPPSAPYQPPTPGAQTRFIVAVAGPGGSISPQGSVQVQNGASQAFVVTPNSGFNITSVMIDGRDQGAITSYIFNNVIGSHTITAAFAGVAPTPAPTPVVPPTPTPTPPPVSNLTAPTADMLGAPSVTAPSQLTVGDMLNGQVTIPTAWPSYLALPARLPSFPVQINEVLKDSAGNRYPMGAASPSFIPGQSMSVPIQINTAGMNPGTYQIVQTVRTSSGAVLGFADQYIGSINILAAAVKGLPKYAVGNIMYNPPDAADTFTITSITPINGVLNYNFIQNQTKVTFSVPVATVDGSSAWALSASQIPSPIIPPVPVPTPPTTIPTVPTPSMFGNPTDTIPDSATIGDMIQGNINYPTNWPASLALPVQLPSYPILLDTELVSPSGQSFPFGTTRQSFTPGNIVTLPVSFDTSQLTQAGTYKITETIRDQAGNVIGPAGIITSTINILAKSAPPIPTPPNVPLYNPNQQYTFTWDEPGPLGYVANLAGMEQIFQLVFDRSGIPATVVDVNGTWGHSSVVFTPKIAFPQSSLPAAQAQFVSAIYAQQGVPTPPAPGPAPAAPASLVVLTDPITQGNALQYKFTAFQPNQPVSVSVQGGGGVTNQSDANGNGVGAFIDNDPAGHYMLQAQDQFGHMATRPFDIQGFIGPVLPTGQPSLSVQNSPNQGSALQFSWKGFQPRAAVNIYVQGGGGISDTSDASGAGSDSFYDNDAPGPYTLVAEDSYGHRATAQFSVR